MTRASTALVALIAAGPLGSCSINYRAPVQRPPETRAEEHYRRLWETTVGVLREYGFEPEFQDRRNGLLTTYAESSGHLLEEAWRKDYTSLVEAGENTVQTIYRAARVRFHHAAGDRFDVQVTVAKARSNTPEAQITDASEVVAFGRGRMPRRLTFDELRRAEGKQAPLVPLGRDDGLADRIARDIRAAAGLPAGGFPPVDTEDAADAAFPETIR